MPCPICDSLDRCSCAIDHEALLAKVLKGAVQGDYGIFYSGPKAASEFTPDEWAELRRLAGKD